MTLNALLNAAEFYEVQGNFKKAEACAERAYKGHLAQNGAGHGQTLIAHNRLALTYKAQGRHRDACRSSNPSSPPGGNSSATTTRSRCRV